MTAMGEAALWVIAAALFLRSAEDADARCDLTWGGWVFYATLFGGTMAMGFRCLFNGLP